MRSNMQCWSANSTLWLLVPYLYVIGVKACGIEIQEHLVDGARKRAAELGLAAVTFVHANAADVALSGSVFFLYAPFNGELLASVLQRLRELAHKRSFVVCTVGVELDVSWLRRRAASHHALAIYDAIGSYE